MHLLQHKYMQSTFNCYYYNYYYNYDYYYDYHDHDYCYIIIIIIIIKHIYILHKKTRQVSGCLGLN